MTTTLVIEECAGCAKAKRLSRDQDGGTVLCLLCETLWNDTPAVVTATTVSTSPEWTLSYRAADSAQRYAPPVATLAPCADRNRRERNRAWQLIPDMALLAAHFSAIEGRAQSIEPSVQNGGARDENDRRARERATAVAIHSRLCELPGIHRAVIEFALIRRDGSKLGDDDEKTAPAVAKARETAFEGIAVAFATKAQRDTWAKCKSRAIVTGALRKIGRTMFGAARRAYEKND